MSIKNPNLSIKEEGEKGYKEGNLDGKMGLFGRGHGFMGLSKRYNAALAAIFSLSAFFGIVYFISSKQILLAMSTLAIWIIVMIEVFREA